MGLDYQVRLIIDHWSLRNLKKELISDPITKLFGVSEYEVSLHKIYKFPSACCLSIIYNMK